MRSNKNKRALSRPSSPSSLDDLDRLPQPARDLGRETLPAGIGRVSDFLSEIILTARDVIAVPRSRQGNGEAKRGCKYP